MYEPEATDHTITCTPSHVHHHMNVTTEIFSFIHVAMCAQLSACREQIRTILSDPTHMKMSRDNALFALLDTVMEQLSSDSSISIFHLLHLLVCVWTGAAETCFGGSPHAHSLTVPSLRTQKHYLKLMLHYEE